ncbi:MAG: thiamine pyrophosphate-dependent enzyme [Rickettsiales bacterium]|nr:thiamine pyrophosphate-dependent enzyme [Rickettsiales bacterium]
MATIGEFLFQYLHSKGVRHAFGIPGDFALPTFRWLDESPIDLITLTHEPSVGFAADGYARVHKTLGVACVTYCVGGLNMLNSVACAYAEKSPLLVISGGPSASDRAADSLIHHKVRTFDTQHRIFEEVTCASAVLLNAETAADEIIRVVEEMERQSRPGYIEIPFDVVDLPITEPKRPNHPLPESDPDNLEAFIEDVAAMIEKSSQPVIIADVELHRHGLTDLATDLAQHFNIPIASTLLSKSVISEKNPLYIGVYSGGLSDKAVQDYIENSDCIIMLGAFITDVFLGLYTGQVDRKRSILLTTEKVRIGLRSYEHVTLKDALEKMNTADITPKSPEKLPKPAPAPQPLSDDELSKSLSIDYFFRQLSLQLPDDATVVCDTGDAVIGAINLRTGGRNHFLSDAYYLSMGFSIPAGIGAMAGAPDSRCVCIVGDGAFQMTGIELSTAAKYGMNPIVFLLNNDGYGTQRHIIDGSFNNIHPWDYTQITELLRYGKSYRVTTCQELHDAMQSAFASTELNLIEVVVPRDDASPSLRRMGEQLGKLRDSQKRES